MRGPGIEPGSTGWKPDILTVKLPTHEFIIEKDSFKVYCYSNFVIMRSIGFGFGIKFLAHSNGEFESNETTGSNLIINALDRI